jgi:hypothetical protein
METLVLPEAIQHENMRKEAVEQPRQSLRNDAFSRAGWLEEGVPLLLSAMQRQLDIGDWALKTPAEASREEIKELLEEAAARTGYDVNVISAYRTVAKRIPPQLRRPGLSWYAYKEISKLAVSDDEDKSLALRSEFVERFASDSDATIVDVRSAVRERMNKKNVADEEMQTVSFKLTNSEFASLKSLVETHPIHESIQDFVQDLVRNFLVSESKQ